MLTILARGVGGHKEQGFGKSCKQILQKDPRVHCASHALQTSQNPKKPPAHFASHALQTSLKPCAGAAVKNDVKFNVNGAQLLNRTIRRITRLLSSVAFPYGFSHARAFPPVSTKLLRELIIKTIGFESQLIQKSEMKSFGRCFVSCMISEHLNINFETEVYIPTVPV